MPPILYLIDGHALAYRNYFAITAGAGGDRFQTSSGEPTAGIFGFASSILRILENEKPEYLAVAFDTGKTFRHERYPDYKATRAKMPEDLRPQIERIRQMVDAFNFPRIEKNGYEADDVLGSLAKKAVEQGFGVKIYTGDKDLLQLVNDRVIVTLPGRQLSDAKDYTTDDVIEKLGVRPDQVVDYKALVGDTSDNIPGVPGIGPKTAIDLLNTYHTLENILAHVEELPKRAKTRIDGNQESAIISQDLARIRTNIDIALDLETARTSHIDVEAVEAFFTEMEFRSLKKRFHSLMGQGITPVHDSGQLSLFGEKLEYVGSTDNHELDVQIIDTHEKLNELAEKLSQSKKIAFDTETTSPSPTQAKLVGISLAIETGTGYYIPVGHKKGQQLSLEDVVLKLTPSFTNKDIAKIGHNLKYDAMIMKRHGIDVFPLSFDTMIAEWLLNPDSHNLGLKNMADYYLQISMTHIEDLIGKGKSQRTMAEVAIEDAAAYAAADAEVTLQLLSILEKEIDKKGMRSLLEDMEMPLIPVLMEMEQTGFSLDQNHLKEMEIQLSERSAEIEKSVMQTVGYSFNLNSTQQLSKALFETLGLEPPNRKKKTASGFYSTSADVLQSIQNQHEVIELILEYRELAKLISTYIKALPEQVNPLTGRIHTSFNQTGSVTGRLASSDPNLQNIPTRTELGNQVRKAFIAAPNMTLLSVDYSQIELRIVAHMANDKAMLAAFQANQDIHAATAAAIYDIPIEEVSKDQRRHAKAVNFGLIYGMSAFGLSNSTDLTLAEAENFVKAYFEEFPGVKTFLDHLRLTAAKQGYVETMMGHRRYFPNLANPTNKNLQRREEREAINAPIQGTAADIIKLAMIQLPQKLAGAGLKAKLLLQVHDELLLECPTEELEQTVTIVRDVMENVFTLSIPLETEARAGGNWGTLMVL
jgi:DNA polymerase-1